MPTSQSSFHKSDPPFIGFIEMLSVANVWKIKIKISCPLPLCVSGPTMVATPDLRSAELQSPVINVSDDILI